MNRFVLDENLRPYATDRQWEVLTAWAEHGSQKKAAAALGCDARLLHTCREAVIRKAALRGYAPDYKAFNTNGVPPGFVLKGQSVYTDANGNLSSRWDLTRREGMDPEDAKHIPDPKLLQSLSTMTDSEGRVIVQWAKEKADLKTRETLWQAFAKELAADIKPFKPVKAPKPSDDDLLAFYPVGDHHMGMYAWHEETGADYDLDIAENLLCRAMDRLTTAAGEANHALIAFLGDFLHYDSFASVTPTSKNLLDSDTRFPKLIRVAVRTMRYQIDAALAKHSSVRVIVELGNHDPASAIFLAELLRVAYEKDPRVTVDTSPRYYHYYRFGKVLIGTHHGHKAKMDKLPLTMAADRPADWGESAHRYWWTGHIHKDKTEAEDFSGCKVESVRVLASQDAWSHQESYRSMQAMKAVVYHREHGERDRHTVNPGMLG